MQTDALSFISEEVDSNLALRLRQWMSLLFNSGAVVEEMVIHTQLSAIVWNLVLEAGPVLATDHALCEEMPLRTMLDRKGVETAFPSIIDIYLQDNEHVMDGVINGRFSNFASLHFIKSRHHFFVVEAMSRVAASLPLQITTLTFSDMHFDNDEHWLSTLAPVTVLRRLRELRIERSYLRANALCNFFMILASLMGEEQLQPHESFTGAHDHLTRRSLCLNVDSPMQIERVAIRNCQIVRDGARAAEALVNSIFKHRALPLLKMLDLRGNPGLGDRFIRDLLSWASTSPLPSPVALVELRLEGTCIRNAVVGRFVDYYTTYIARGKSVFPHLELLGLTAIISPAQRQELKATLTDKAGIKMVYGWD